MTEHRQILIALGDRSGLCILGAMRARWARKSVRLAIAVATLAVAPALALPAAARDAGLVVGTNGNPMVTRSDKTDPLRRNDAVLVGDVVATDATSKAKILLNDDSILSIGPTSRIRVDEFTLNGANREVQLNVLVGRFKLAIAKFFGSTSRYQVFTPTAVIGVRGTVLWGDTTLDAICALDGTIEVTSLKAETGASQLNAGQCVTEMGKGKLLPLTPTHEELDGYLRAVTLD